MKLLSKNKVLVFLLFLIITLAIYWPLYFTFYQQDEWQGIGYMLALGFKGYTTSGFSPIEVMLGQGRILTAVVNYILFRTFLYNISLLATYAIILHAINTTLVYFLSFRIFKKGFIALICTLFFCLNAVGNQAVIWFGASVAALTAAMFVLISLQFFITYLDKQKNNLLWISYAALLISLYFKESGLGLIPFYTLVLFLTNKKKIIWQFVLKASLPILIFICFTILRIILTVFTSTKTAGYISSSAPLTSTIFINFIRAVFTVFGQMLIPQNIAIFLGDKIVPHMLPFLARNELAIQSIGINILMVVISCIFLSALFFLNRNRTSLRQVIFFVLLVIACILPYVFIAPGWSYFESRYYYVPAIGVSLLVGSLFLAIWKNKKLFVLLTVFFTILLGFHVNKTYNDLFAQKQLAQQRLAILYKIKQTIPLLNKKTVLYITSNQTYTVPNNPLPMQQGVGYTMQVWLFNNRNERLKKLLLLPDTFLWVLGSEGYRQIGDQGFGYFSSWNDLQESVGKYHIDPKNVYSFYWNGNAAILTDTTKHYREKLK